MHIALRGNTSLTRRGFSPLTLFASSEQGVWLDPSDMSTMYQDAAGTTPVTAAGQVVGLVLDKSKGLVLGPEVVTNGGFDSDTSWIKGTGWTIGGGVASKVAGVAANLDQFIPAITRAGFRRFDFTVVRTAGTIIPQILGGGAGIYSGPTISASGTYSCFVFGAVGNETIRLSADAAFAGTIDNISVRELPGNHATQATAASKPILQQDAAGKWYLAFDGVDDFLVTATITPGVDKAQVFAGVRKLSDAALGALLETSAAPGGANPGWLTLSAPRTAGAGDYSFNANGTATNTGATTGNSYPAPETVVLTGTGDIVGDSVILRRNGAVVASSALDRGTGNFLAYPLYIGRRGGTSLPFNGRLYQLITRFGANLDASTITKTESWLNQRTGAY